MLYRLLYPFHTTFSVLNVTGYITFRTAAASLTALAIGLALGPWLINKLRVFQIGQVIRQEGPATHAPKARSTPIQAWRVCNCASRGLGASSAIDSSTHFGQTDSSCQRVRQAWQIGVSQRLQRVMLAASGCCAHGP